MARLNRITALTALLLAPAHSAFALTSSCTAQQTVDIQSCGLLNRPCTSYHLTRSVSAPSGCFDIRASDVTLDLGGHTVTYGDAGPIVVANGSFESEIDQADWDFSEAPEAKRLQKDPVKDASVALEDRGRSTIAFPIPRGPQTVRYRHEVLLDPGTDYSLSFVVNHKPRACTTVEACSARKYVELVEVPSGRIVRAEYDLVTWRPPQFLSKAFRTPASESESGTKVRYQLNFGVDDSSGASANTIYIDDIRIQRHNTVGVRIGPGDPVTNRTGSLVNVKVVNGTIRQGRDSATEAHGIYIHPDYSKTGFLFKKLNLEVHGPDSRVFYANGLDSSVVTECTLKSNLRTVTSRDNMTGIVLAIRGFENEVSFNRVDGGANGGLSLSGRGPITTKRPGRMFGNTVSLRTLYTNSFGIHAGSSTEVFGNLVYCVGDTPPASLKAPVSRDADGSVTLETPLFTKIPAPPELCKSLDDCLSCRGIAVGAGSPGLPTLVYGNISETQLVPRNSEYGGCGYPGYGIQLEDVSNAKVLGNLVRTWAGQCDAAALRINHGDAMAKRFAGNLDAIAPSVYIKDNIFEAKETGAGGKAYTLFLLGLRDTANGGQPFRYSPATFFWNTLFTNGEFVRGEGVGALTLDRTYFGDRSDESTRSPFVASGWNRATNRGDSIMDLTLLTPMYLDASTRMKVLGASVTAANTSVPSKESSLTISMAVKVRVLRNGKPVPAASVTITDVVGGALPSVTTGSDGRVEVTLTTLRVVGEERADLTPFSVSAESGEARGEVSSKVDTAGEIVVNIR